MAITTTVAKSNYQQGYSAECHRRNFPTPKSCRVYKMKEKYNQPTTVGILFNYSTPWPAGNLHFKVSL